MRNWSVSQQTDTSKKTWAVSHTLTPVRDSKTWLVPQQNGRRASRLGLCHNKWTPARCKNTKPRLCHNTLIAARIPRLELCHKTMASARIPRLELCHKTMASARTPRLELCHKTLASARIPRLGLCHKTLASARTPRLELCHKTLASARIPRLELSQLHIDSSKNTKTRAVSPTLTPVTTARLGLCHLH